MRKKILAIALAFAITATAVGSYFVSPGAIQGAAVKGKQTEGTIKKAPKTPKKKLKKEIIEKKIKKDKRTKTQPDTTGTTGTTDTTTTDTTTTEVVPEI